MATKMFFHSIFLILLTQNVYYGNCHVETRDVKEGDNTFIECIFYIGEKNENDNYDIIWFYPALESNESRIDYDTGMIQNRSIYSILTINNATKAKDQGKYDCLLYQILNNTEHKYLIEKNFYLRFNKKNVKDHFEGVADEVDGPIENTFFGDESKIKMKFSNEPPIEAKTLPTTFDHTLKENNIENVDSKTNNKTVQSADITALPMDKSVDEKIDKLVKIFGSIIFVILIIIIISCIWCCIRKRRPSKRNVTA